MTIRFRLSLSIAALPLVATAMLCASGKLYAEPVEIPAITIFANQAPTLLARAGASVTVLTGTQLRESGASTVADALRTVPGVAVSQGGSQGSLTQTRIRGSESNHVLFLIDGVPVNDFANGDFNLADFSLEDIERVEVVRGPQSGIYGANAHAGVVSIVTKSGRGLAKPEVTARIEGGTHGTLEGATSVRGAAGPFYGSLSFDQIWTNGYNISHYGSERDGSRARTVTAKVGIDLTPDLNVEANARQAKRFAYIDPQQSWGPYEGLVTDSVPDFNSATNTLSRIAATWKLFDGALVQRFTASHFVEDRSDDDTVNGFYRSLGKRNNFEYKATATTTTNVWGGERHTFTFAADRQTEFLTADSASFIYDPSAAAFWAAGARRTRNGLAGEYSVDLPSALTLTGALRHDRNSGFADLTTWRITASQRFPSVGTRLHSSIGTGATDPTFIDQFGFFVGSFIGNPNLRPEQSLGWDAGIEQTFMGGRLITDVTVFGSDFRDKITFTSVGGGFIYTEINAPGISTRRGVEATMKFNATDWLTLAGTYTYTDARLADGTPETRRPRNMGSASATVRFNEGRGRAIVNVVYNGTMPDTWFRYPLTPVQLNAYTTVGGQVEYDIRPGATVYVRAENIFNARYEEVFSYRAPGFAAIAGFKVKTLP